MMFMFLRRRLKEFIIEFYTAVLSTLASVGTPGTTVVWADENTREGIFDGIKRKESYRTSGTFIRLSLFDG